MDFSQIISLIVGFLGGTGTATEIIKLILTLVGKILEAMAPAAPVNMDVAWVQRSLAKLGFDPGPQDGLLGPKTQKAIVAYQQARGLDVDGWLGVETQTKLRMEAGG